MPRAPKQCGKAGCTLRVTGRSYCLEHQAERERRQSNSSRGYGVEHRTARARALAALVDGSPCPLCGEPRWRAQQLHLDHTPDRAGYRGLVHARCNTSDGGKRAHR